MVDAETRAGVFDFRKSSVAGPRTEAAITRMVAIFERVGVPIAVVASGSATQRLQISRVLASAAPTLGQMLLSMKHLDRWCSER